MVGFIYRSNFLKNILITSSGTVISQTIVLASMFFLTRLYTSQSFGYYSIFSSIILISACISTGKFEQAIFLPKTSTGAGNTFNASIYLNIGFSVFLFLVLVGLNFFLPEKGKIPDAQPWIFLIPLSVASIGMLSSLQMWFSRLELYRTISLMSIVQTISTVIGHFLFAFYGIINNGLIYGYLLGNLVSICILLLIGKEQKIFAGNQFIFSLHSIKKVFLKYPQFPRYTLLSEFVFSISQQALPLLLAVMFNSVVVGLFAMGNRFVRAPLIVISNSVWGVFRNEIVKKFHNNESFVNLLTKTVLALTVLIIVPFFVIVLFAPQIFTFLFGVNWYEAGIYASITAPMLFSEFVSYPISNIYLITGKQKILTRIQLAFNLLAFIAVLITKLSYNNPTISLRFYSYIITFMNIVSVIFAFRIRKYPFKVLNNKALII